MHTAFFKHAQSAGLMAALLSMLALLAGLTTTASAQTGGEAPRAATPSAATPTAATQQSTAPSAGTPTGTETPVAPPASGLVSGGAAPLPGSFHEAARATWYGPGFYGHTTACGQKLTPKLVGLASRTLPCGTLVQIDYRGHTLTAPVLDRGPFGKNGALWDLTSGAARALKITETVRILTQIIGSVPDSPTLGEPSLATTPSPVLVTSGPPAGPSATAPSPATTGGVSAS